MCDMLVMSSTHSGLKIVVTHLPYPRQYKVNDVTSKNASEQTLVLSLFYIVIECPINMHCCQLYENLLVKVVTDCTGSHTD